MIADVGAELAMAVAFVFATFLLVFVLGGGLRRR